MMQTSVLFLMLAKRFIARLAPAYYFALNMKFMQ